MKLFLTILFSFFSWSSYSASCCVANTAVPNLMILPSQWQQTFSVAQTNVVGESTPQGTVFRNQKNREYTNMARMDLAYHWLPKYQSGVSVKYQNKNRDLNGTSANDSGWSDVGIFHAYQPNIYNRTWIFQNLNIPTSRSIYDSKEVLAVDAQGTGTYITNMGLFHIQNYKEWDYTLGGEVHYSFARTFHRSTGDTELGHLWGGSISVGGGYIPWRSKFRYGANISPRLEGPKNTVTNGIESKGKQSLVWDSSLNVTYTVNASHAVGINYLDQTLFGPARNTLLYRTVSLLYQTQW